MNDTKSLEEKQQYLHRNYRLDRILQDNRLSDKAKKKAGF